MTVDDSSQKPLSGNSLQRFLIGNRWQLIMLGIIAFLFALPSILSHTRSPIAVNIGDIAQEDIIAPVQFEVQKDPDSLEAERKAVLRAVPMVLLYDTSIEDSVLAHFDEIWARTTHIIRSRRATAEQKADSIKKIWQWIDKATREKLISIRGVNDFGRVIKAGLKIIYSEGFISSHLLSEFGKVELFSVHRNKKEEVLTVSMVMNDSLALVELEQYFERQFRQAPEKAVLARTLAEHFVVPNLLPDVKLTEENRKRALSSVSPTKMMVSKGEKIIGKHEKIDYETYLKLRSLHDKLHGSSKIARPVHTILAVAGTFLVAIIIITMFGIFIYQWYSQIWNNIPLFGTVAGCMIFLAAVTHTLHIAGLTNYSIPINFVAALLAFIIPGWVPFAAVVTCLALASVGFAGNATFFISAMLSSAIIAFGMQKVYARNRLYLPILYATIAGTSAVVILNYAHFTPSSDILSYTAQFGLSALFSPFLAYLVLPLAEKVSRVPSEFTIFDLADINSMILQKLAIEAPGTFHHSIMVGNMAAAAAEAVGADSILARAGGYYHDIGKLVHPEYFDENQTGRNVHDTLSPDESYRVISAHTTEGVEIGKLHGLPEPIIDIIEQHHGTSVVEFFYRKALSSNPTISPDQFRYHGPKPKTLEATIIMICDIVEAASRSSDFDSSESDKQLRCMIEQLVQEKMNDGQFNDSPISIGQIHRIIDRLVPTLRGARHKRVPIDAQTV